MAGHRPSSRKKILAAAADLARQSGPVRFSLDAVASHAGVSKGGLLYNFPSKAKLMQGLVEDYLEEFERALDAATAPGKKREPARRLCPAVDQGLRERASRRRRGSSRRWPRTRASSKPIDAFRRRLLERLRAEATDPTAMLVTFLAMEGLRSMKLFGSNILTRQERGAVTAALLTAAGPSA